MNILPCRIARSAHLLGFRLAAFRLFENPLHYCTKRGTRARPPRKARPAPHLRCPRTCKAHGAGGGAEGPVHPGDRVADEPAQHAVVQAQAAARVLGHQLTQKVPAADSGVSTARHAGTARGRGCLPVLEPHHGLRAGCRREAGLGSGRQSALSISTLRLPRPA